MKLWEVKWWWIWFGSLCIQKTSFTTVIIWHEIFQFFSDLQIKYWGGSLIMYSKGRKRRSKPVMYNEFLV